MGVVQLAVRLLWEQEVAGSSPATHTTGMIPVHRTGCSLNGIKAMHCGCMYVSSILINLT